MGTIRDLPSDFLDMGRRLFGMRTYKQKLIQFNKTANYKSEYELLRGLLGNNLSNVIVDYGCGTGFLVDKFRNDGLTVMGYDVNDYWDHQYKDSYRAKNLPFNFNTVYFMHSISHIPNLSEVLRKIYQRINDGGRIIVITPNPKWLELFRKKYETKNYKPDTTVVKHLDHYELFNVMNDAGFNMILEGQIGSLCDGVHERIIAVYQRKYV